MQVKTITVLGAGIMGSGIAHSAAIAGFETRLYDISDDILEKARKQIHSNLQKGVELNKLTPDQMESALSHLSTTSDFAQAARADFVIEAVPERMDIKIATYTKLDSLAPENAVFATNTSSLSITEMASATGRPRRFIGMHFFNPVHKMKLVEIIRGLETDDETFQITESIAKQMGKETVSVKESPGFVTSRINAMIGNEAFYMLQEGVATARDIDLALKLGLNHPMGPFEMADLVGLDTRLATLTYLHQTLGEKYRPCPLMVQYVKAGRLGRKVGKGVYDYTGEKK